MKAKITIDLDNAVFEGKRAPAELAKLLQDIALKMKSIECIPGDNFEIRDINGNIFGKYEVLP